MKIRQSFFLLTTSFCALPLARCSSQAAALKAPPRPKPLSSKTTPPKPKPIASSAAPIPAPIPVAPPEPPQPTMAAIVPASSAMGRADSLQQVLLSSVEADSSIDKAAYMMRNLSVRPTGNALAAKLGQNALWLQGDAEAGGGKGDFSLGGAISGKARFIGLWVYLPAKANVDKLGFQLRDGEGEYLLWTTAADWQGWKWVEVDLQNAQLAQPYPQADKNKKIDLPITTVHVAWFAKEAGPSRLGVDALVAATEMNAPSTVEAQMSGASWGETDTPLASQQIVLTNFSKAVRTTQIDYSVQSESALYSTPSPNDDYGSDEALGAPSWTEAEGRRTQDNSLTDNRDWTNASLSWGSHKEATQTIDLGRERTITRLAYVAGDPNWAWKVSFSASSDGKTYQDAPIAEEDMHGKTGRRWIVPTQPFKARFLRLRHHNGGADVNVISMPAALSVYDGTADEKWEIPTVGETVSKGALSPIIAPRSFGLIDFAGDKSLAPGAYLVAARVRDGARTQMLYRHFLVMPAPLKVLSPASRFGLNGANYLLAPLHRRLGIGWVRFENVKWPMVSPALNVYDFHGVPPWNLPHDDIVKGYRDQGISFLPFLFQTPEYATSAPAGIEKNRDSYPPKDNALMADFVFQTVARYGSTKHAASELKTADKKTGLNQINTYEIWNEPNLTDPNWGPWVGTSAQYNEMFRAAAQAVKRADVKARVTNGGLAGIDVETLNTLLTPYADGKKPLDFVDILNVHFYSGRIAPETSTLDLNADRSGNLTGGRTYEEDLARLSAWRDKNKPGLPIWMSETGYDSAGPFGTDEQTQAARLPRVVMMTLAAGIEKVLVYRESGSTPSMHAAAGVLRNDETLKPSWFTYATLIRELDGVQTGAVHLPYPDANVRVYAWTRGAETILSAWAIEGSGNLNLDLGNSIVTDSFGHTRPMSITGKLPLSTFPIYIKKIGNMAGLKVLLAQAKSNEAARRAEHARKSKLRAYVFDFGSRDKIGTIDIGDTRSFTSVLGSEVYDEQKGYGFFPAAAGQDNVSAWINDPLERDSTRMNPENIFRLHAKPGRYLLRISLNPQGTAQLTIKGALGGDKTVPIVKDGPVFSTEIQVGAEPLSISNNGYGDIRWLSLVEQAAGAAATAKL